MVDAVPAVVDPIHPQPVPTSMDLAVTDLTFRYGPDEAPVLDGLSFDLPAGKRLAIVGVSGAGKSTLLNLLLRFWDVAPGRIWLGGQDVRSLDSKAVRACIGVVSQRTHLFNDTVRANLLVADPQADDAALAFACRQAQIHDFITGLPDGYDTWIGEQGLLLSGGERQRLAIARALLKNAPILILDEATAHLDAVAEQEVWQALAKLMTDRTTLVISHQPAGLELMDEVLVLENGRLVPLSIKK